MKNILKRLMLGAVSASIVLGLQAGECCKLTAEKTKAGGTCVACLKKEGAKTCCIRTAEKTSAKGEAKPCEVCAKAKKD